MDEFEKLLNAERVFVERMMCCRKFILPPAKNSPN